MLVKPLINEYKTPRHTLEDENDDDKPNPIPNVLINVELGDITNALILPSTLQLVQDQFMQYSETKKVGQIELSYSDVKFDVDEDGSDYDEDEQLYKSIKHENLRKKYPNETIPIYQHDNYIIITIPNFKNIISYNQTARYLRQNLFPQIKHWILLAPCNLNNNQPINQLFINYKGLPDVPILKPPHVITGICGCLISQFEKNDYNSVLCLLLNSEGQSGFEKLDNDSIIDALKCLSYTIKIPQNFIDEICHKIRKFNNLTQGGMYI